MKKQKIGVIAFMMTILAGLFFFSNLLSDDKHESDAASVPINKAQAQARATAPRPPNALAPVPQSPDVEAARQQAFKKNEELRQQERWAAAHRESERLYGVALTAIGLDEVKLSKVKQLLAEKIYALEEIQNAARTSFSPPTAVPDTIKAVSAKSDEELLALVGIEAAKKIAEIQRVEKYLTAVQSRHATNIANASTPLTASQVLTLAEILYEVQEPLVMNFDAIVMRRKTLDLRDGLSEVDTTILDRAQSVLTSDQLNAFKKSLISQNKKFADKKQTPSS